MPIHPCPFLQHRYGYKCRFLGGHISEGSEGNITLSADEDKKAQAALTSHEMNFISQDVQKDLRSRKVRSSVPQYLPFFLPTERRIYGRVVSFAHFQQVLEGDPND